MFGFDNDNFLGPTVQPNRWHKKWDVFFAEGTHWLATTIITRKRH